MQLGKYYCSLGKSEEGKRKMVRRSILEQIFKEMMNMRQRLDNIENNFSSWNPQPVEVPESSLIALPDHLRKTYIVVATRGECDAVQVSNRTGRCRAIESNYLNQLLRMGWVSKRRISKTVHFRPISKSEGNTIPFKYLQPRNLNLA
jgi:ArsR family transcriptional regulator, lead/cadmium/zinc/bismuth-responsive transcriptional repressor